MITFKERILNSVEKWCLGVARFISSLGDIDGAVQNILIVQNITNNKKKIQHSVALSLKLCTNLKLEITYIQGCQVWSFSKIDQIVQELLIFYHFYVKNKAKFQNYFFISLKFYTN